MPEGVPIGSRPRRNRIVLAMKQERVLTLAKVTLDLFQTSFDLPGKQAVRIHPVRAVFSV
jgi:hypothetical protein